MKLVVISHKLCWKGKCGRYYTDGGFPMQIGTLAELFETTTLAVPISDHAPPPGTVLIPNIANVVHLDCSKVTRFHSKVAFLLWMPRNLGKLQRAVREADAIHAPIPGDIGTVGIALAMVFQKPLFVRHCGNWLAPRTLAERFWKRGMEFFAGGKNVMLATGGANRSPSDRNPNLKWIFSTSLKESQMTGSKARTLPGKNELRLITVSRQEPKKGTNRVIESLPRIAIDFPRVQLDIVGDGSMMPFLKKLAADLGVMDRVRFHGKVKQPDVLNLLRAADIFCYPTHASEGFPKVVLEALSAGLPVVTTTVSVLPILIDESCGKIITDTSPPRIASAVMAIARDAATYEDLSRGAIARARGFTLERWRDTIKGHLADAWGEIGFRQLDVVGDSNQ